MKIINISKTGINIIINDQELSIMFQDYPQFLNASLKQIFEFELINYNHLHWPKLDIDINVDALINPGKYPLIYRK